MQPSSLRLGYVLSKSTTRTKQRRAVYKHSVQAVKQPLNNVPQHVILPSFRVQPSLSILGPQTRRTKSFLEKNKDTTQYTSQQKLERIHYLSVEHRTKHDVSRLARASIFLSNQESRREKLRQKFWKSELCLRRKVNVT